MRRLACLLLVLCLTPALTGCVRIAGFYTNRIRPASFYVDRYCYELPKERITKTIAWMLKRYNLPLHSASPEKGLFETKATLISRFSRNPNWGYVFKLKFKVTEYKGKLPLGKLPAWAFTGDQPKLPPYPQRSDFPSRKAYYKAQEAYSKKQRQQLEISAKGFQLMKKWEGCNIKTSTLRTKVEISSEVWAHPVGGFGKIDRSKGCKVTSDRSLEYAMLRVIAWRNKKLRHIRPMLYSRTPRYYRGSVCKDQRKPKAIPRR